MFACRKCLNSKKIQVTAKAQLDENGKEYFRLGRNEHLCTPQKVVDVITSDVKIKEITGIAVSDKEKNEDKLIINDEGFELRPNRIGVPDYEAIIFDSNDRSLCYRFVFFKSQGEKYFCVNCRHNKNTQITAMLKVDKNGKKYMTLNKNYKHLCDPIKYQDIQETKYYNFLIFNMENKNWTTTLIVFTSEDRKDCYEFRLAKPKDIYHCAGCKLKKLLVSAKIWKDGNGKEYVKFGTNKHLCVPQEFCPEKFEQKKKEIIESKYFELFPNTRGVIDARLIIFDNEDEHLAREYISNYKKFNCLACDQQFQKYVSVKIVENDSQEKFAEMEDDKHACTKRNLIERKKMFDKFKIQSNPDGNQKVTVTDINGKSNSYQFTFDEKIQLYCCIKCREKGRYAAYKIWKNKENKEYFILNNNHICDS